MAERKDKEVFYVGDPMCSWCYGFTKINLSLQEQCKGRAKVSLVVGGLHIDWTEPQDDDRKRFLREHWEEIGERSGQPFVFDILDRDDFVYNTEPACRAAVTARVMHDHTKALEFFVELQRAFYAENIDVTQPGPLRELAEGFGLDGKAFAQLFDTDDLKTETMNDFQFARALGVNGFPTMVVREDESYAYLTVGYQPFENLQPALEGWLES